MPDRVLRLVASIDETEKHTLGGQTMQVQKCLDGALKVLCVCFAFTPFVSCSIKQSRPQQKMNEIHHMFKCLMVNYTNSMKIRSEGVKMWFMSRTRPKLKFIALMRGRVKTLVPTHTHFSDRVNTVCCMDDQLYC